MARFNQNKKLRILLLPGAFNSPAARFRIWNLAKPLKNEGYEVTIKVPYPDRESKGKNNKVVFWYKSFPRLSSLMRFITMKWILKDAHLYDYVIANRDFIPELRIENLENKLILKGCKLIFDFDDAIYLGLRRKKLNKFLPNVHAVVAGNDTLAKYALSQNSNVMVIPTVVDTSYYHPVVNRQPGILRIGWSGSEGTNLQCLPLLQKPLEELSQSIDFEFIVISNPDPQLNWKGVKYRFIPWSATNEVQDIQLFDIGLMPLEDKDFERGKCGAKAIQYMGAGIPALVSPVGANEQIVSHGVDGFHCRTNDDWITYLLKLAMDSFLRNEMGIKAREKVVVEYSVHKAVQLWRKILV